MKDNGKVQHFLPKEIAVDDTLFKIKTTNSFKLANSIHAVAHKNNIHLKSCHLPLCCKKL